MRVKNVCLRPIRGISSRPTVKIVCVLLSLHPYSVSKHANNQEISTKHPNTRVFCRFEPVFKSLGLRKSLHLLLWWDLTSLVLLAAKGCGPIIKQTVVSMYEDHASRRILLQPSQHAAVLMPQALQAMFDSVALNHIIGTNAGIKLGYYSVMLSCLSSLMCATARQAQTCLRARAACECTSTPSQKNQHTPSSRCCKPHVNTGPDAYL